MTEAAAIALKLTLLNTAYHLKHKTAERFRTRALCAESQAAADYLFEEADELGQLAEAIEQLANTIAVD